MSQHGHPSACSVTPSSRASRAEKTIDSYYLAGNGAAMHRVRSQIQRIAPYFRMALITGEAGTGKETVARVLHERSAGAAGPFVAWRAAEFEERLRREPQSDLLRPAYRGTLFVDGLGSMSLGLQMRFLRVLQQHEGLRWRRSDLRIIAANDRELRTLSTTGQFHEELYRRIAAVEIWLTPLRQRCEDLPAVAEALLRHMAGADAVTQEAIAQLQRHYWPGNVRELKEVLEQAATATHGAAIEPDHLAFFASVPTAAPCADEPPLERLQDVVQRHVLQVLMRCAGNKLRASEVLGISRSTLYRMLDAGTAGGDPGYTG